MYATAMPNSSHFGLDCNAAVLITLLQFYIVQHRVVRRSPPGVAGPACFHSLHNASVNSVNLVTCLYMYTVPCLSMQHTRAFPAVIHVCESFVRAIRIQKPFKSFFCVLTVADQVGRAVAIISCVLFTYLVYVRALTVPQMLLPRPQRLSHSARNRCTPSVAPVVWRPCCSTFAVENSLKAQLPSNASGDATSCTPEVTPDSSTLLDGKFYAVSGCCGAQLGSAHAAAAAVVHVQ